MNHNFHHQYQQQLRSSTSAKQQKMTDLNNNNINNNNVDLRKEDRSSFSAEEKEIIGQQRSSSPSKSTKSTEKGPWTSTTQQQQQPDHLTLSDNWLPQLPSEIWTKILNCIDDWKSIISLSQTSSELNAIIGKNEWLGVQHLFLSQSRRDRDSMVDMKTGVRCQNEAVAVRLLPRLDRLVQLSLTVEDWAEAGDIHRRRQNEDEEEEDEDDSDSVFYVNSDSDASTSNSSYSNNTSSSSISSPPHHNNGQYPPHHFTGVVQHRSSPSTSAAASSTPIGVTKNRKPSRSQADRLIQDILRSATETNYQYRSNRALAEATNHIYRSVRFSWNGFCPNLTRLILWEQFALGKEGAHLIAAFSKNLQYLSIVACRFKAHERSRLSQSYWHAIAQCQQLKYLTYAFCRGEDTDAVSLQKGLTGKSELTSLHLRGLTRIGSTDLYTALLSSTAKLQELSLENMISVNDMFMEAVMSGNRRLFQSVQRFTLNKCGFIFAPLILSAMSNISSMYCSLLDQKEIVKLCLAYILEYYGGQDDEENELKTLTIINDIRNLRPKYFRSEEVYPKFEKAMGYMTKQFSYPINLNFSQVDPPPTYDRLDGNQVQRVMVLKGRARVYIDTIYQYNVIVQGPDAQYRHNHLPSTQSAAFLDIPNLLNPFQLPNQHRPNQTVR